MSMLILCTGKPLSPLEGSYTSAAFDAAAEAVIRSAAQAPSERRILPGGRVVWIGEGLLARSTAEQILEPCELHVEPLLNEISVRAFSDSDRPLPAEKWLRKAAAQRKSGDPRQPESREAVAARADALIRKLEETGTDSLPSFSTAFAFTTMWCSAAASSVSSRWRRLSSPGRTSTAAAVSTTASSPIPAAASAGTRPCAGRAEKNKTRRTGEHLTSCLRVFFYPDILSNTSDAILPLCTLRFFGA